MFERKTLAIVGAVVFTAFAVLTAALDYGDVINLFGRRPVFIYVADDAAVTHIQLGDVWSANRSELERHRQFKFKVRPGTYKLSAVIGGKEVSEDVVVGEETYLSINADLPYFEPAQSTLLETRSVKIGG